MNNKVLYLNVMNNAGSSILYDFIADHPNSVFLKREGQSYAGFLKNEYELRCPRIFSFKKEEVADPKTYDVEKIKSAWMKEWKRCSKYSEDGKVLIQKSPSDVYRVNILKDLFPNTFHIFMIRNPYATCEGTVRRGLQLHRNQSEFEYSAINAAVHWCMCAEEQMRNISLMDNIIVTTYEDLIEKPEEVANKIVEKIPELEGLILNPEQKLNTMWLKYEPIKLTNKNDDQIKNLTRESIRAMNEVFKGYTHVFDFFGYKPIIA